MLDSIGVRSLGLGEGRPPNDRFAALLRRGVDRVIALAAPRPFRVVEEPAAAGVDQPKVSSVDLPTLTT